MRRLPRILLLTALLTASGWAQPFASDAAGEKKTVAVMPFSSPTRYSEMGRNAQPTFITQLVKARGVRVVSEKLAKNAVKRFAREMTGLYDQNQVRQMGRFLKADYVVTGMVAHTGDAFTMTVHVTNVETLELEMAEDVDFRHRGKMRVAVRTLAQKIASVISGEGRARGRHEAFLNIDARDFYDAADACIESLGRLDPWTYEGEIDEELGGKKVHVMLERGKPKPGLPLQVLEEGIGRNDEPIGVVYVTEPDDGGGGFLAEWIDEKDPDKKKKGSFGLGVRVSNAKYRYRIAVGEIADEAGGNVELVTMFRDRLIETMEESERFVAKSSTDVDRIAVSLGRGSRKRKNLKRLHELGVDFVIEGRFIGAPGSRRADFDIISTATGKRWDRFEFETRI